MCAGSAVHYVNGEKFVPKTGELLLLGPHTTQKIEPSGEKHIAVNFIILPEFLDKGLAVLGTGIIFSLLSVR